MAADTLGNLAAYMIQIAAITAIAELLTRVVPVSAAGFRYAYWRVVLAGALVAPWLLRQTPVAFGEGAAEPGAALALPIAAFEVPIEATDGMTNGLAWPELLPWLFAAGVAARVLWVIAGLSRLRGLRNAGIALYNSEYEEIQRRLGTSAEFRAVPGLAQPVTFGLRRPVVLLPEDLAESIGLRRAVVTHELIHVQRRDWLSVLAEEALRAVFWFHPAIWWLTSRVRLAREEFTDHLAVLATGSRRAYMEALIAFAERSGPDPAPAFARRAYLFQRIVLLSKEAAMSSRRVVVSGALVTALLVTTGWLVSDTFPVVRTPVLRAAAAADTQLPQTTPEKVNTVTPENPIPRRLFSTPIPYPPELTDSGFVAAIEMAVVLNAGGSVASVTRAATAISRIGAGRSGAPNPSPEDLQRAQEAFAEAAANGVRQWQYDPPASAPLRFYVAAVFAPGQPAAISQSDVSRGVGAGRGAARVGSAGVSTGVVGGVAGGFPSAPPLVTASGVQPVRVGGSVRAPMQTRKVNPVYPAIAQSARVQGVVILEALIDEQGRVANARVLRSIPLLDQAAIDAVRQWEYVPTLLNGAAVPVIMTVTVQFTLPEPTQPF